MGRWGIPMHLGQEKNEKHILTQNYIKASFTIWNHHSHGDKLVLRMKSTGAFPYFQNPIWSKHIGKLEIRQSKYNKRLFSVALRNTICAKASWCWFGFPPTKQTTSFYRDSFHKWLKGTTWREQWLLKGFRKQYSNLLESKRTKKSLLDLKAIQMCLFSILIFFRRSDGYLL